MTVTVLQAHSVWATDPAYPEQSILYKELARVMMKEGKGHS